MGIMKTAAEIAAQNEKIANTLLKQCLAAAKKAHIYIGHNEVEFEKDHWVMIIHNSNGGVKHGFASDMQDIISKNDRATVISIKEHPGTYDWPSRTYNEDASEVRFKIK